MVTMTDRLKFAALIVAVMIIMFAPIVWALLTPETHSAIR